jgi:tetratricopeptide (TPR) repeat protein
MRTKTAVPALLLIAIASPSFAASDWNAAFTRGEAFERSGRYEKAAEAFEEALAAAKRENPNGVAVPVTCNNLGVIYRALGRSRDAERSYRSAIAYYESHTGLETSLATTLENLAALELTRGQLSKAEPLYRRSYEIRVGVLPPGDPAIGQSLQGLALLEHERRNFDRAEAYYREAIGIEEKAFGKSAPQLAPALHNLAALLAETGRNTEARILWERTLKIYRFSGATHPEEAVVLRHLAELDAAAGLRAEADAEFRSALAICEGNLPADHPQTGAILQAYGLFLKAGHRGGEAGVALAKARNILAKDGRETGSTWVVDAGSIH